MKKIQNFQEKRISIKQSSSIKGGVREFLKMGTGNPVNHARYRKACREAENIMLVQLHDGYYFCIDW